MKKIFSVRNLMAFVFLTFIGSSVFLIIRIVLSPSVPTSDDLTVRVKSDYVLMLLQCILGVLALLIPGVLWRFARLVIPSSMLVIYAIFLFCAIYLGEIRSFYYNVPHWDTILHTCSGIALGALGFSLVSLVDRSGSISVSLSPAFVAIFAFCFALSLGVIWEFYEFTVDSLLDINMQKYALEDGELLVGRSALADTMKDLIVDALGALIISIIGYLSLKLKKGWFGKIYINK